jgi:hypothetical protein
MDLLDDLLDIHICGACRNEFHDVKFFIQHKKRCPALAKLFVNAERKKNEKEKHSHQQSAELYQQQHPQHILSATASVSGLDQSQTKLCDSIISTSQFSQSNQLHDVVESLHFGQIQQEPVIRHENVALRQGLTEEEHEHHNALIAVTTSQFFVQTQNPAVSTYSAVGFNPVAQVSHSDFELPTKDSDFDQTSQQHRPNHAAELRDSPPPLIMVTQPASLPATSGTERILHENVGGTAVSNTHQQKKMLSTQLTMLLDHDGGVVRKPGTSHASFLSQSQYLRSHLVVAASHSQNKPFKHSPVLFEPKTTSQLNSDLKTCSSQMTPALNDDDVWKQSEKVASESVHSRNMVMKYRLDPNLDRFVLEPSSVSQTFVEPSSASTSAQGLSSQQNRIHYTLMPSSLSKTPEMDLYCEEKISTGQSGGDLVMISTVGQSRGGVGMQPGFTTPELERTVLELTSDAVFEPAFSAERYS